MQTRFFSSFSSGIPGAPQVHKKPMRFSGVEYKATKQRFELTGEFTLEAPYAATGFDKKVSVLDGKTSGTIKAENVEVYVDAAAENIEANGKVNVSGTAETVTAKELHVPYTGKIQDATVTQDAFIDGRIEGTLTMTAGADASVRMAGEKGQPAPYVQKINFLQPGVTLIVPDEGLPVLPEFEGHTPRIVTASRYNIEWVGKNVISKCKPPEDAFSREVDAYRRGLDRLDRTGLERLHGTLRGQVDAQRGKTSKA